MSQPEPASPASDFLSVAQVARALGCSVSLVQKWRRLGWLPATRLGPTDVPVYGYREADVAQFVRERWNRRRGRPPGTSPHVRRPKSEVTPPTARLPGNQPLTPRPLETPAARVTAPAPSLRYRPEMPHPASPAAVTAAPAPAAPAAQGGSQSSDLGPQISDLSGRPLVLWDDDPHARTALVLARFSSADLEGALRVADAWAHRSQTLALGELPPPGGAPRVLAAWRDGRRAVP